MKDNATWTDRKHYNTALKAAIAAIPLDCSGPLVESLVEQLLKLKAANKAAAANYWSPSEVSQRLNLRKS